MRGVVPETGSDEYLLRKIVLLRTLGIVLSVIATAGMVLGWFWRPAAAFETGKHIIVLYLFPVQAHVVLYTARIHLGETTRRMKTAEAAVPALEARLDTARDAQEAAEAKAEKWERLCQLYGHGMSEEGKREVTFLKADWQSQALATLPVPKHENTAEVPPLLSAD